MPTYQYATIPARDGDTVEYFEVTQRMADAPLTRHPDTGVPVQRVISGGLGFVCERAAGGDGAHGNGGCSCHP